MKKSTPALPISPKFMTDLLGLPLSTHENIPFLNLPLDRDTKLFYDPCLTERASDETAVALNQAIQSFFDRLFFLYKSKGSDDEKLELFKHLHENNAPRLGYGTTGLNGHAKTPEGMLFTLKSIEQLFEKEIPLSKALDLTLFIRDFDSDCLSDLIVNVGFKVLNDFTVSICRQHGTPLSPIPDGYFYWDIGLNDWENLTGNCLLLDGKPILFTPKHLVRNRFSFNAGHYFSNVICVRLQQKGIWVDDNKNEHIPTKKEIKQQQQGKHTSKATVTRLTAEAPDDLNQYHSQLPSFYKDKCLSDKKLDEIIYAHIHAPIEIA